jgi:hypothetical protein
MQQQPGGTAQRCMGEATRGARAHQGSKGEARRSPLLSCCTSSCAARLSITGVQLHGQSLGRNAIRARAGSAAIFVCVAGVSPRNEQTNTAAQRACSSRHSRFSTGRGSEDSMATVNIAGHSH